MFGSDFAFWSDQIAVVSEFWIWVRYSWEVALDGSTQLKVLSFVCIMNSSMEIFSRDLVYEIKHLTESQLLSHYFPLKVSVN